ncbi:MAG: hypothetical protein DRP18_05605, partial [Candidatus Aenigmatarchaeota archaeon]
AAALLRNKKEYHKQLQVSEGTEKDTNKLPIVPNQEPLAQTGKPCLLFGNYVFIYLFLLFV